jgi:dTDP-glucose 4,6-dehydratase
MRNVLVTGGCGFIGGVFIEKLLENRSLETIVNIDKLTYASTMYKEHKDDPRYLHYKTDICDFNEVREILGFHEIDTIVHFAAETHVDNSIEGPEVFVNTNVMGTFNMIESARKYWESSLGDFKFIHVSTDEVYGYLHKDDDPFTEESNYDPSSPYSASKAGADHLVLSYYRTYNFPVIVTNCSNNYGATQHDEKLIPTIVRNAVQGRNIPVYGTGENIRDWILVDDHCDAIMKVLECGKFGEKYNIGSNMECTNLGLVYDICHILDDLFPNKPSHSKLVRFVDDRAGHDFRYAIDSSKVKELGWIPSVSDSDTFDEALRRVVRDLSERYME